MKYANATAKSLTGAKSILFGADTRAAGHSQSVLGQSGYPNERRTPDFVRATSHESPSLAISTAVSTGSLGFDTGASFYDAGDISIAAGADARTQIELVRERFAQVWAAGQTPFCIGGDHLIKHAAIEAIEETPGLTERCLLVYVDAHPDTVMKDEYSYQTVLHQALKRGRFSPESVFIVGLRQVDLAEAEGLRHWKPRIVSADEFSLKTFDELYERFTALKDRYDKVYVSIDLDGLDPSCAPAVEAPFPGGPSLAQVVELVHRLGRDFRLIGLDISEFIPALDNSRLTALSACRLLNEAQSCLL